MNRALRGQYLAALGLESWILRHGAGAGTSAQPRPVPRPDVEQVPSPREDVSDLGWAELRTAVAACTRCPLSATRTQTVFGVGSVEATWLIVGEAPGAEEDRQGEPFVGRAGQLAQRHAAGDRPRARAGFHRQCPEVPATAATAIPRRSRPPSACPISSGRLPS